MSGDRKEDDPVKRLRRTLPGGLAVAAVLAAGASLAAHHTASVFYDESQSVDVTGTVSRFVFRNPHSFLYLDVTDARGQKVEYQVEMVAASNLVRRGWNETTLKAGDTIKVVGAPSRNPGTHGICCATMSKPDGSPVGPPPPGR